VRYFNVDGSLAMLLAARSAKVAAFENAVFTLGGSLFGIRKPEVDLPHLVDRVC
jgi:hypothetical protein